MTIRVTLKQRRHVAQPFDTKVFVLSDPWHARDAYSQFCTAAELYCDFHALRLLAAGDTSKVSSGAEDGLAYVEALRLDNEE